MRHNGQGSKGRPGWLTMTALAFDPQAWQAQAALFGDPEPGQLAFDSCGQCGARGEIMDMFAEDRCADVLACLDRRAAVTARVSL